LVKGPGSDVTPTNVCNSINGDFAKRPCPDSADIVAGCFIGELGDGSKSYWWYYRSDAIETKADVRQKCEASGDTFAEWTEPSAS
jgi:hypothetical protein